MMSLPAPGRLRPKPEPSEAVQSHGISVAREAPEERGRWEPLASARLEVSHERGGGLAGGGRRVPFQLHHLLSACGPSDVWPPSPPGAL